MVVLLSNNYHRIINYWMASALFGSNAIGYGDLFHWRVDNNQFYRVMLLKLNRISKTNAKIFHLFFTVNGFFNIHSVIQYRQQG